MSVAFTGTRKGMTSRQEDRVAEILDKLNPGVVHHGCCEGADRQFHSLFHRVRELHPSNEWQYLWALEYKSTKDLVHGITPPLQRNRFMVDACQYLIAAPFSTEIIRSGTWFTVRFARIQKRHIYIVTRDGSHTEETLR